MTFCQLSISLVLTTEGTDNVQRKVQVLLVRLNCELKFFCSFKQFLKEKIMSAKDDRRAMRMASPRVRSMIEFFQNHETEEIQSLSEFCQALEANTIHFFTFTCLSAIKGREEIKLDLLETFFFRRFRQDAEKFFTEFNSLGVPYKFIVIVPDHEPVSVWGWEDVSQDEITGLCKLMIEDQNTLPDSWECVLWSEIASKVSSSFEHALGWARVSANSLWVKAETEHLSRFPEVADPKEAAIRQIAGYAHEGRVLEELFPSWVLLQSNFPAERKDRMYSPLRKVQLPIIHPFTLK